MLFQDLCDHCCSRKSDDPLIEAPLSILAGFDDTGQRVFKPLHGKWCDWRCMRREMKYRWIEAYKEAQRKLDHEESAMLLVRQKLRDHQTRSAWQLQEQSRPLLQKTLNSFLVRVTVVAYRRFPFLHRYRLISWRIIS